MPRHSWDNLRILPITGFIALILGALALIFGLLGVSRVRKGQADNKVMSWISSALALISIILGIIGIVIVFQAANQFVEDMNEISGAPAPAGVTAPATPGEGPSAPSSPPPVKPTDELVPVTYAATSSTGTASVTYGSGADGMSIVTEEVPSSWSKTVQMEKLLGTPMASLQVTTPLDMSAPIDQEATVTCEIKVNGKTVDHQAATGSSAYVMCGS